MTARKPPPKSPSSVAAHTLGLPINRIDELFAPAVNPFAADEIEVLGQSGIDFLHRHYKRRWPRRWAIREVVIQLPPEEYRAAIGSQDREQFVRRTQTAIEQFCSAQIEKNRADRKLAMAKARQELRIALLVALVALILVTLFLAGKVSQQFSYLQAIVTILAVFAASLAIWDALESVFFDWVPYTVENRAYRWITGLDVHVAPLSPDGLSNS